MNACIRVKNLFNAIVALNDLVIQVNISLVLKKKIAIIIIKGSYSQHINQRNKYCKNFEEEPIAE